jgi:hypothetical protein
MSRGQMIFTFPKPLTTLILPPLPPVDRGEAQYWLKRGDDPILLSPLSNSSGGKFLGGRYSLKAATKMTAPCP